MSTQANSSRWRRVMPATAAMIGGVALLTPIPAWAQFYVRQPDVKRGESEVEDHGAVYAGPGDVLEERCARGEIDRDEYLQKKRDMSD